MISVTEGTVLVSVSEFRSGIDEMLKKAQNRLVIIEKRHKPVAVLMSQKKHQNMQDILELAEDFVLGDVAHERYQKSSEKDYISIEMLLRLKKI